MVKKEQCLDASLATIKQTFLNQISKSLFILIIILIIYFFIFLFL